jgi:isoamylase
MVVCLTGDGLKDVDTRGRPVTDDSFVPFFNAAPEGLVFQLPPSQVRAGGRLLVDTSNAGNEMPDTASDASQPFKLAGRSLAMVRFQRETPP